MMSLSQPQRPPFRAWRRSHEHGLALAAARLGVSVMQVSRYELPFDDPKRQIPREEVLERIFEWTEGAITPQDFYPPHLRTRVEAPQAEAAR